MGTWDGSQIVYQGSFLTVYIFRSTIVMELDLNSLIYKYLCTESPKLAKKFKNEVNCEKLVIDDNPVDMKDIVAHFLATQSSTSSTKKRKVVEEKENVDNVVEKKAKTVDTIDPETPEHLKGEGGLCVYIRNIGKQFEYSKHESLFTSFGPVESFTNHKKGFGFLQFSTVEAGKACIAALNNTELDGKIVKLNIARNSATDTAVQTEDGCKLFVHGVKQDVTEESLSEAFGQYGKVQNAFNPGKGFAFVTFASAVEASAAVEATNGKEVCGNEVSVNVSKPKPKEELEAKKKRKEIKQLGDNTRIYVGNVKTEAGEERIKEIFSAHGNVKDVYNTGKGFAFVSYDTKAEAESAVEALNGSELCGETITCNLAKYKRGLKKGHR